MIESFNQVADVLVRILTKIKRDFQPAQQELQNLETQFQLMNDRVLSMKQTIRNINSDRPREKPRKQNFWNSSIFDDLQCLNDGERSELNWLLSEFLVLMERNEDGGICLMLLLKRIQSIKTNKTGVDRIQLEQLESGPLLQLVNKYSTCFTSNKEASPIHTKEAPLVPKSIKKTEEIPNQVEPTNDGGGGEGGDSDDYGDHGDDSEDDGERSSISFWLVIQCFLFRFFALQYHKNKSHFKSNAKPVVLEKQILDFWKKSKRAMEKLYRLVHKTVHLCSCLRRKRAKLGSISGCPLAPWKSSPSEHHPLNLQDLCLMTLARNVDAIKRQRIDCLPAELAQRLFDEIESIDGLDSETIRLFSRHVLTRVTLRGNREANDDWISMILASHLTVLDVSYCQGITDRALTLIKKFTLLERLNLDYCTQVTDHGVISLSTLLELQSLSVRGCDRITGKTFLHLTSLKKLTIINFELCRSLITGLEELPKDQFVYLQSLRQLKRLELSATKATVQELKELSGLKNLREIGLMGFKFNREGLNSLKLFCDLESINIERAILEFSHLDAIAKFSRLKSLKMGFTRVNNRNFQIIAQISSLTELEVNACRISDRGLTSLSNLTNLKSINLSDTFISNGSLEHICKLSSLTRLNLGCCEISDEGLAKITSLVNLQDLDLDSRELTDESMPYLSTLTMLTKLDLFSARIKDDSLRNLMMIKDLKSLELCGGLLHSRACMFIMHLTSLTYLNLSQNCHLGDQGISKLTTLSELRSLNLTSTRLSDNGLEALESLNHLEFLVMYDTNISEAGVGKMLRTRPSIRLLNDLNRV
eukprot:g3593.t1